MRWDPTEPSSWRAAGPLSDWLRRRGRIGMGGVDTRRLTRAIRHQGAPHVALAHDPSGAFDIEELIARARAFPGLVGMDLAREVTCTQSYRWDETRWAWPEGHGRREGEGPRVVAIDYGAKRNILRSLASQGFDVHVLPATASAEDVLALDPRGAVFCRTGRATRPPRAPTPCPRSARCSTARPCPSSASASDTSSWRSRSARAPSR